MPEGAAIFPGSRRDGPGLALFLNAGDPSFEVVRRLVALLDEHRVDCLELAVPFPNPVTDGPVIQRSARRAIDAGADLSSTLSFVATLRPHLERLKIVLMADWRHTVRALPMDDFLARVRRVGCDGLLVHGVPPRARPGYYDSARRAGVPLVTTCFVNSSPATMEEAAVNASAYLYLAARYGTGESGGGPDPASLAPAICALRELSAAPVAVGFGISTGVDVRTVWEAGGDAAIVGSACVRCVERALEAGRDPAAEMRPLLDELGRPS